MTQFVGYSVLAAFLYYIYIELAYGGGNPNHKDHNRPPVGYPGLW